MKFNDQNHWNMRSIFKALSTDLGRGAGRFLVMLILILGIGGFSNLEASHYRYGSMSWQEVSGTSVQIKISQGWRSTFFGSPSVGASVNTGTLYFGDGSSASISLTVTSVNVAEDWFFGETTISHNYPSTGNYVAYFSSCCRIGSLSNNSNGNFRSETLINVGGSNSSPVTTIAPIINIQTNLSAATFTLPAVDPDGDVLSYRLATAAEAGSGSFTAASGLSVDASTGVVTFNTVGKSVGSLWNTALVIEDGGSKTMADFIIKIVDQSTPPYFDYATTPVDGFTYQVSPGTPVTFDVLAKDVDLLSTVGLSAVGLPIGSAMNPNLPVTSAIGATGSQISSIFSWTPSTSQLGSFVINFTAQDNNGVQTSTSMNVQVSLKPQFDVPPTPAEGVHNVYTPGDLIQYTVQASDPDPMDVVTINKVEGKDMMGAHIPLYTGASFSPLPSASGNPTSGVFTWQTQASDWGHRHVFYTAEDSYGDIAVHEVSQLLNTTPVFTSTAGLVANIGSTYTYNVVVNDPDVQYGDAVDVLGFSIPSWLTFVDNGNGTATLTGTPTLADVGTYPIVLEAQDINHHLNIGGIPTQSFSITVNPCLMNLTETHSDATCKLDNGAINLNIVGANLPLANTTWSGPTSFASSAPSINDLADGVYTVIVEDALGCIETIDVTISDIIDTLPPVMVVYDTVEVAIDKRGRYKFQYPDLIKSDDEDCMEIITYSPRIVRCDDLDEYINVTVYQRDVYDNITSKVVVVKPVDVLPPDAYFFDPIVIQLDKNGEAFLYESSVDSLSGDNCSSPTFTLSKWEFNCADMPAQTVGVTIEDASGNSPSDSWTQVLVGNNLVYVKNDVVDSYSVTVNIDDCLPPVALCKDVEVYLDASGIAKIDPTMTNDGSFDNCGMWYYTLDDSTFTCTDTGSTSVNMHAYDLKGNMACCPVNVTIRDTIKPVAVCKDIVVYLDSDGLVKVSGRDLDGGTSGNCDVDSFELSDTSFTCVNINQGPITVQMTAIDNNGNASSCSASVTVLDTIKPTVVCKNINIYLDETGMANIVAADVDAGSSDNCTISSIVIDKSAFSCTEAGVNSVILTVTDNSGNVQRCTTQVTVLDTIKPTVVCKNINAPIGQNGYSTIKAADVIASMGDNCGTVTTSISDSVFACSTGGMYSVTVTVTDASGNSATCIAKVMVIDKPEAKCKDVTVYLDANGMAQISINDIDDGSYDNCGLDTLFAAQTKFSCADLGMNHIDLIAGDADGNYDTCKAKVTVLDTIDPYFISCQCDVIRAADLGECTANVTMQCPVIVDDNCSVKSVINDYNNTADASDVYPVGLTTITWTVTDQSGNTSEYVQVVLIVDDQDPVVTCTQDITVSVDAATCSAQVNVPGPTATDNCGIKYIINNNTGISNANATYPVGTTTIEWIVEDDNGNFVKCYSDVTVVDDEKPVIACGGNIVVDTDPNKCEAQVVINTPTTSDNCGVATIVNDFNNTSDASSIYPVGNTTVTWTVTDIHGNSSTCSQVVTVEDNEAPSAVCQNLIVSLDASGQVQINAADINDGSDDACGIANMTVSPSDFNCTNVGPNTVTLTVTDIHGNSSTCSATVTVEDNTAPTAVCKSISVSLDNSGIVSIDEYDVNDGSSDACGIASMSVSPSSFDCSHIGPNTVTLTVVDANGNSSTCSAIVTVKDNTAPKAICKDVTISLDANGEASITAADINNGSSDNCAVASVSVNQTDFDCSHLGTNTVTLTVIDVNGNSSTCTSTVTVEDNILPVIYCQNILINLDANGKATITQSDIDFGSYDNCADLTYVISQSEFDCDDLGSNVITYTITDGSGNQSVCNPTIIVADDIDPTIVNTPTNITITATSSNCSPSVTWTPPTADDNCDVVLTSTHNSGDNFPIGTTTVTYTATDDAGNSVQTSFTVTVNKTPIVVTTTESLYNGGFNVSCYNGSDGSIAVQVAGGCEPYTYSWSSGQTTSSATDLVAGTYTITVTDNAGEIVSVVVELVQPTQVAATMSSTDISCGGSVVEECVVTKFKSNEHAVWLPNLPNGVSNKFVFEGTGGSFIQYPNGTAHLTGEIYNSSDNAKRFEVSVWFNNKRDWAQWSALGRGYKDEANVAGTNYQDWSYYEMDASKSNTLTGLSDYAGDVLNLTHKPSNLKFAFQVGLAANSKDADYGMSGWFNYTGSWNGHGDFNLDGSCSSTNQCDGSATTTASGGVAPYTYLWSNGSSSNSINDLCAGTYSVTITDANGCQAVESVTITAPTQIVLTTTSSDATCSSGTNGSASVSVSGGTSPYTYDWSTGASTTSINNLVPGTYSVTVTDANGCQETATVEISRPVCCNVTAGGTIGNPQSNCGPFDPTAITSVQPSTGGLGTLEYVWLYSYTNIPNTVGNPYWMPLANSNSETFDPGVVSQTTYYMRCARRAGCSFWAGESNVVEILVNPIPVVSVISTTNVSCFGLNDGAATVSGSQGTAPYSYSWSNGATTASNGSLTVGTYSVTVTDANGCSAQAAVTITEPAELMANASSVDATCATGTNGTASVSANGGTTPYSYLWSTGATTAAISSLSPGTYSVTVTDANGCEQLASVSISRPACCNVTAAGTIGNGQSNCGPFDPSEITNVQSPSGGLGTIEYIWLSSNVNVANTSGNPYWSTIAGSNSATYDPGMINQTTYYIRCSRRSGCSAWVGESNIIAMVVNPQPIATISSMSDVSCFNGADGSATVVGSNGTAPYTYSWTPTGGTNSQATGLAAGTYNVTITDANGCNANTSVQITEPSDLVLSGTESDVTCANNADGSIDLTVQGGTSPYSYSWSNGSSTEDISSLAGGHYSVSVTDANGCTAIKAFDVDEPQPLTLSLSGTDVTCFAGTDGSIDATILGGTSPYNYSWSGPSSFTASTEDVSNVAVGTYTLQVVDANGCSITVAETLDQGDEIAISGTVGDATCFDGMDGTIDISVTGGSSSTSTSNVWVEDFEDNDLYDTYDNGSTAWSRWINSSNYYAKVKSRNSSKVFEMSDGDAKWYSESISISGLSNVNVSLDLSSCTGNYLDNAGTYVDWLKVYYRVDNGSWTYFTTNYLTYGEISGTISATVSGLSGTSLEIKVWAHSTASNEAYRVDNVTVSGTSTTSSSTYAWSNGETTEDVDGLEAGTYTVTVTEGACSVSETFVVGEPTQLMASASIGEVSCAVEVVEEEDEDDSNSTVSCDCEGKMKNFKVTYTGPSGVNVYAYNKDKSSIIKSFYNVNYGDVLSIDGFDHKGRLDSKTYLKVSTKSTYYEIHTSCSINILGMQVGDFKVKSYVDGEGSFCDGTSNSTASSSKRNHCKDKVESCECEGKMKNFTMLYNGPSGVDVNFYKKDKSSLVASFNNVQMGQTLSVDGFDHLGRHDSKTYFNINGGSTFYEIHTSCSVDILGLAIGNFVVTSYVDGEGNFCNGTGGPVSAPCDGAIDLTVNGGSGPYTYLWSNGETTEDIYDLCAGDYTVVVTDANGCERIFEFDVEESKCCNVTDGGLIADDQSDCGAFDPSNLTNVRPASGGKGGLTYAWFYSATSATYSTSDNTWSKINGADESSYDPGLITTSMYLVRLAKRDSCPEFGGISNVVELNVSGGPDAAIAKLSTGCQPNMGLLEGSINGGVTPVTHEWLFNGQPMGTAGSISVQVNGDNDDAEEKTNNGDVSRGGSDLELGNDKSDLSGSNQIVGMKFRDLQIPIGATVTDAYIKFKAKGSNSGYTNVRIYGDDSDDASSIGSSDDDLSDRTPTSNSVAWNNVPSWFKYSYYNTPNISSVMNEIVSRNGWVSGNDVVLMIDGTGYRKAYSHDGSSYGAPLLVVEYRTSVNGLSIDNASFGTYQLVATDANGCVDTATYELAASNPVAVNAVVKPDTCVNTGPRVMSVVDYNSTRAFYLPGLAHGNEPNWTLNSGVLTEYSNGTAKLTGRLTNNLYSSKQFDCEFYFTNKSDWSSWSGQSKTWKGDVSTVGNNYKDWTYYDFDGTKTSKLIGRNYYNGTNLVCTQKPSNKSMGLQIGDAANDKDSDFGLSTWFYFSGGGFSGSGDINADASVTGCNPLCNGAIDLALTGGSAPYNVSWSNNATSTSIDGLCAGTYTATVVDANGCVTIETFTVGTVTGGTATRSSKSDIENGYAAEQIEVEESKDAEMEVSPNPAKYAAVVNYELSADDEVYISVTDITGKEMLSVFRGSVEGGVKQSVPVDFTQLRSGVYQVVILSTKGQRLVERVVVSR